MKTYFALSGTCCLGKTTVLNQLKQLNYPVGKVGDFYEHQLDDPRWKEKGDNQQVDLAYQAFLFTIPYPVGSLLDRFPFDNIVYSYVFKYLNKGSFTAMDLMEASDEIAWVCSKINMENWDGIIFLSNTENLVERMLERNNGIDFTSKQYVTLQNTMFSLFASNLKIPVVEVNDFITAEQVLSYYNVFKRNLLFGPVIKVLDDNVNNFAFFHLHITYGEKLPSSVRQTEIILPIVDGMYHQYLSTEKIHRSDDVRRIMVLLDPALVLGVKLEGIKCKQSSNFDIKPFCYYEEHFKGNMPSNTNGWMFSISVKHSCIVGAKRTYNQYDVDYKNFTGEVCIYENWINNVERPWLENSPNHFMQLTHDIVHL